MSKKMLIDAAHPEEVRVAVADHGTVEDFDFEAAARKPLRGNIYLARVTRVEPSLQAAFVEYGGNRHGFLAFSEIHPDYYQIPVADREKLQAAEAEVADLAAKLELTQRGDDLDDDDSQNASDDAHGSDEDAEQGEAFDEEPVQAEAEAVAATASRGNDDAGSDEGAETEPSASDDQPQTRDASPADDAGVADTAAGENAEHAAPEAETEGNAPESDPNDDQGEAEPTAPAKKGPSLLAAETPKELSQPIDLDGEEPSETADAVAPSELEQSETGADDDASSPGPDMSHIEEVAGDDGDVEEIGGEDLQEPESLEADSDDSDDEGDEEDDDEDAVDAASAAKQRAELLEQYREAKRARSKLLRNYKIQEVIKRRQILLVQVVKEERGNKGAALTTYLSLAGRYCVLMPNTARGGGISRKIASSGDRRRLRRVVESLDVPTGMGLIIRTAGAKRTKTEIKRDYDYLLRLWENIRTQTLESIAPCLIHEEASLIKRAIRDLYDKDISTVLVSGDAGYRDAKDFMKMLMPSHAKNVQPYKDKLPIFVKYDVENQLDAMYQPTVRLKSGGYLVIHQTEALVAIDVNSGRATRERNIEQTALRTNIEAAQETARQCRLRDLAGLIVIDFIDMEDGKNNRKVERALKDALKIDRARIQVGRISSFGLMEMSRQRRRSGLVDGTTHVCPTCDGAGVVRSVQTAAMRLLRAIEGEAVQGKAGRINVRACMDVCLHILNSHRAWLKSIEETNGVSIEITVDPDKAGDAFDLEKSGAPRELSEDTVETDAPSTAEAASEEDDEDRDAASDADDQDRPRKRRRRRRRRKDGGEAAAPAADGEESADASDDGETGAAAQGEDGQDGDSDGEARPRRRRGRRGGRRNRRGRQSSEPSADGENAESDSIGAETEANDAAAQDKDAAPAQTPSTEAETGGASVDVDTERADASVVEAEPDPSNAVDAVSEPTQQASGANGHAQDDGVDAAQSASDPEPAGERAVEPTTEQASQPANPAPKKSSRKGWWQRALGS